VDQIITKKPMARTAICQFLTCALDQRYPQFRPVSVERKKFWMRTVIKNQITIFRLKRDAKREGTLPGVWR
jgi:hypothetical protein